ncbi:MAG: TfoX/Sxy family protein [Paracoccus sp. (in: a-proteobacteria)]
MKTTKDQAGAIAAKLAPAGEVLARPMFGEYGLYLDGVFIGVICGGLLYLKPTEAARALLRAPAEAAPYPGARPHLQIADEDLNDPAHMAEVIALTIANLPKRPARKKRVSPG